MKKRKPSPKNIDAERYSSDWAKEKESLRRRHRKVIYFNDKELAVIEAYCSRFNIKHKSSLYRRAIISLILQELDKNHPTLF